MRHLTLILLTLAASAPALAAEPSGCDKFKWPIDRERAVLTGPAARIDSGATIEHSGSAVRLALRPMTEVQLPFAPERMPREPDGAASRFAGYLRVTAIPSAGTYVVSLSGAGWLDAIQEGKSIKPAAFSGATDCEGIRKLVKFELQGGPLLLQISAVATDSIVLAISPPP
jgi:hypothetical protein